MTVWKRLDHVGLVVADMDVALEHFCGRLGMRVVEEEQLEVPPVRLVHLEAGEVTLQLVQPLPGNAELSGHLAEHGEGLHHICFEVGDLLPAVRELGNGEDPALVIEGGRRRSAFVPGALVHGLRLELTQEREEAQ